MGRLRYTLVADGSSDRSLVPILTNGREPLNLPSVETLEALPDPKEILHDLLRRASGLRGRRLASFNERLSGHRVAELIEDFRPLYRLTAFQRLAADVARTVKEQGWSHSE